ncbi:MAG: type IV secretory system conjugative DNA transfer family protein [Parcubacteria group bacterium]|nr:type IV secretory system conjugative DNA transfer family protein [Parcubacteria group bacterium]
MSFFQTLLSLDESQQGLSSDAASFFEIPFLEDALRAVLIFAVAVIMLYILRFFVRKAHIVPKTFEKKVLLVTLPKEASAKSKEEFTKTKSVQETQEKIGAMETFFSTIGGMKPQSGFLAFLFGREDHISFEIVADEGLISFYIAVPQYLERFLEHQIHAQFPTANIEEVEDYNIFTPQGTILGTNIVFTRDFYFPIKSYKKMDTDPLNALTNVLSKLAEHDGAAIQIVARPAKGWHRFGHGIATRMAKGKSLDEAVNEVKGRFMIAFVKDIGEGFYENVFGAAKKEVTPAQAEQDRRLSSMEEEMIKGLEEKSSKAGLECNIRIVVSSQIAETAKIYLENIVNTFHQHNLYEYGNSLKRYDPSLRKQDIVTDFIYRNFDEGKAVILNTEEMSSVFHFPLPENETPNIRWLLAKNASAPTNIPKEGLLLGYNEFRGVKTRIFLKSEDRRRHMYIIGKSGVGKSYLLANCAKQDIAAGMGVCVIDPHGDLVEDVLRFVPKERYEDVVYFDPSDVDRPVGLNMLEYKTDDQKDFAVQEMIAIFYKLFPPEMIGPMFEHNMRNVMLTLMEDKEYPGTIADIPRMFSDPSYQKFKLAKVKDPVVRAFWEKEMAKTSDFHKSEMLGYLISKVGRFVENEMMRNIIGQPKSGFDFREIMDEQKILLVNLAKGKVGEVNSNLLGLIIVAKLQMAAMTRADMAKESRKDFYLYIDEFQNFITDSIAIILSEARKYGLNLILAHQYVNQLLKGNRDTSIRDAIFGNAGTLVSFKIGVDDAEVLAKEYAPVFNEYDLVNIEKHAAYVKLLIDNTSSKAFKMKTYNLEGGNPSDIISAIKQLSRLKYGKDKRLVSNEILERTQLGNSDLQGIKDLSEKSL